VFRFGVQVDNRFSWIGSGEWNIAMKYLPETLVSQCLAVHKELKVELEVNDAVHSFLDISFLSRFDFVVCFEASGASLAGFVNFQFRLVS
jgi:hypothetical protein